MTQQPNGTPTTGVQYQAQQPGQVDGQQPVYQQQAVHQQYATDPNVSQQTQMANQQQVSYPQQDVTYQQQGSAQQYVSNQAEQATQQYQQTVQPAMNAATANPGSPVTLKPAITNMEVPAKPTGTSMMSVNIIADLGNSGGRFCVVTPTHRYYFEMQNRFAEVKDTTTISPKYFDNRSTIVQTPTGNYANGYLVDMEFQNKLMRPVAYRRKADQEVTLVTLHTALARSIKILSEQYGTAIQDLDLSVTLSILLPPLTHKSDLAKFLAHRDSLTTITMVAPIQFQKKIKLDIKTNPEGVSAFFAVFFKEKGVIPAEFNQKVDFAQGHYEVYDCTNRELVVVEENLDFHEGDILVIDIGAGTSDVAVFRNMELIETSPDTFEKGGNTVESNIRNMIKQKYGLSVANADLKEIVKTGYAKEGTVRHDVIDIVRQAREDFATALKPDIEEYFEGKLIEPRLLKGLLVVGGGSLPTERFDEQGHELAPAMAQLLIDYLSAIAPHMRQVYIDKKTTRRKNIEGAVLVTTTE